MYETRCCYENNVQMVSRHEIGAPKQDVDDLFWRRIDMSISYLDD